MIVGLFDLDRTGFPNVALMKLSAWHKAQGDTVLPLNKCTFCVVPQKEGPAREVATIDDLLNHDSERKRPFVVLMDNEFLWKEQWAIARLEEFTARGIDWCPSQGLDIRVVTQAIVDALAASPFWNVKRSRRQITFAFDGLSYERQYRRGVELTLRKIAAWHLQSYVLVGYDSTIEQDLRRIEIIQSYGIDPFVMVYRDYHTGKMARDPQLMHLARWVNRRLCKDSPFEDYWPESRRRSQGVIPLQVVT